MTGSGSYRLWSKASNFFFRACLMTLLTGLSVSLLAARQDILDREITIPRQNTTLYGLLSQISRQTGYFFIYDSELVDNNRRVRTAAVTGSLGALLSAFLDDPGLQFMVVDRHIVIYRRPSIATGSPVSLVEEEEFRPGGLLVRGRVLDQASGSPLPHATILIEGKGMGTISNHDGVFQFRLQEQLRDASMRISYMGYKSQVFPLALVDGKNIDVLMETDYISMQEVIIRYYDPEAIVREALSKRPDNYSDSPVYHTSFYREGVLRNRKLLNYSEAIFRVYKSGYGNVYDTDQAVLLKSRKISNADHTDTLILKIKAGVQSALELDIIKTMPAFIDPEYLHELEFSPVDIVSRDGRSLYAIRFEQTMLEFLPVFSGIFFIDTESLALVSIEFEVHPKHIDRSRHIFLARLHRRYQVNFDRIHYTVQYQLHNGHYHLSHLRGDITMRLRPRNRLFSSNYHAFLEMVVGRIDEDHIHRFSRHETFRTREVFVDQDLEYDYDFWGEYNIISPEKNVTEAFSQIRSKIESIVSTDDE